MDIAWPDYSNCIANLPNSILKAFGAETVGETLPLADGFLQNDYKNVVVLLLDGMGTKILERHLKEDGVFRSHLAGSYKSVYLPTTVAATTSAMSGLQPCEHRWLGWDMYYPQVDKNVTVFLNIVQNTKEPAADYNIAWTVTPYKTVVQRINEAGGKAYESMPFLPPYPQDIDAVLDRIKTCCKEPGRKYIYSYWSEPDGVLHDFGSGSKEVFDELATLEEKISSLLELEDTLVLITADHGHINTSSARIENYPKITDCLERNPSLEPRCLNLFVKDGMEKIFEEEFNKKFGDKFLLMTTEEFLERKMLGTAVPRDDLRSFLGDYIAVATGDLSIYFTDADFKSMHAGLTEDEMMIPLIVFG